LAIPLAACGGDDDGADATAVTSVAATSSTAAPATAAAGSITIEHRHGTTTLDHLPERIVSLDLQWTDVLVALDAPLVGAALEPLMLDRGGRYPWQDGTIPDSVESIPVDPSGSVLPFEAVAALQPDLIVVSWPAAERAEYDRLSEIAPTIPLLGDRQVDLWEDIATVAGRLVGDPGKAEALIAESDAGVDALAAELPGLAGKTYAMANYVPGSAINVVADPADGSAKVFHELGLEIDPDLLAIADGASGRVEISLERIDELDADLLIMLTNGADPAEIPGYRALPAVQDGAVAILDLASVVGLNTPTPRSIPYSLDAIRSALEAAAG
jgi:iron complex transport system substrate-binding protein